MRFFFSSNCTFDAFLETLARLNTFQGSGTCIRTCWCKRVPCGRKVRAGTRHSSIAGSPWWRIVQSGKETASRISLSGNRGLLPRLCCSRNFLCTNYSSSSRLLVLVLCHTVGTREACLSLGSSTLHTYCLWGIPYGYQ